MKRNLCTPKCKKQIIIISSVKLPLQQSLSFPLLPSANFLPAFLFLPTHWGLIGCRTNFTFLLPSCCFRATPMTLRFQDPGSIGAAADVNVFNCANEKREDGMRTLRPRVLCQYCAFQQFIQRDDKGYFFIFLTRIMRAWTNPEAVIASAAGVISQAAPGVS